MPRLWYSVAVMLLAVVGLVLAGAFLATHRPHQWRRLAAWDSAGWVLLVFLLLARTVVLTAATWPAAARGWANALIGIVSLLVVDGLLVVRVVNFRRFLRQDRTRSWGGGTGARPDHQERAPDAEDKERRDPYDLGRE